MGFYNEALLLYKLGRINEAKEFVDKALEINPDYISGLLHKARLMLEIDPIILNLVLMH